MFVRYCGALYIQFRNGRKSANEGFDIDRPDLQWRNANCHCQRHEPVDFGSGFTLAGFAVASVVHGNDGMADAHRKHRVAAVRKITFQKDLFQIPERRAHARNALAKFNEALLDELFTEARLQQPRQQMSEFQRSKASFWTL